MERELTELNAAIDKVMNSNLDDKTKEFVLNELKQRAFELRTEIARVEKNKEILRVYLNKRGGIEVVVEWGKVNNIVLPDSMFIFKSPSSSNS